MNVSEAILGKGCSRFPLVWHRAVAAFLGLFAAVTDSDLGMSAAADGQATWIRVVDGGCGRRPGYDDACENPYQPLNPQKLMNQ